MMEARRTERPGRSKGTIRVRRPWNGGFIAITLMVCLMAGAGIAVGAMELAIPPSLPAVADAGDLPLGVQAFDDARTITVNVTAAPERGMPFARAGKVTFAQCPEDGVVASGSREYDVDGVPLVSLHTDTPVYRDLTYGDRGDDVRALQQELAALGYGGSDSGVFDWATWDAWRRLYAAVGGVAGVGAFDHTLVIWLPEETIHASCTAALGADVAQDSADVPAFTTAGGVSSIVADTLPAGVTAGPRTVTIAGADYAISDDGTVSDAQALASMADWSVYVTARKDQETVTSVSLTYRLATPISVYSVPASALAGLTDDAGCVVDAADGLPVPVRVAGSALGRTLITIDGDAPASIRAVAGKVNCDAR